jgi:tetratricopeptide (TPR) repeat protein
MKFANDWETAIDYIASGIKELPLKFKLLYNYACLSERLGRIEIAIRFFEISMEVRPRWVDSLFALAIIYYRLGDLKKCEQQINIAISNYKNTSFY